MNQDIPTVVRNTAKNMYELLMQLAAHIEKLEAENNILKNKEKRDETQR